MTLRIVPAFALCAALAGACGTAADASPMPALECSANQPAAGAIVEMSTGLGIAPRPSMGRCGVLHYLDSDGELHVEGPALVAAESVAEDVARFDTSRRGDQRLVFREGRVQWQGADGERGEWLDAEVGGFVRDGQAELAWVCGGAGLMRVDASGAEVLAEDVILCPNVRAAPEAPLLAYVGADTELRVLNVAAAVVLDLSEVPFIASANDVVTFSDDGLFLFHEATRAATPRLGIFDLRLPRGERFIAAPESRRGISGIVRAPGTGHVLAFPVNNGLMALTVDGFLNFYEAASLLGFGPDGERMLLVFAPFSPRTTYDYEVADLAALTLDRVAEFVESPSQTLRSPSGQRLLFRVAGGLVEWRWDSYEVRGRSVPSAPQNITWLGDDGALLLQDERARVLFVGSAGELLAEVPHVFLNGTWSGASGPVALVRSNDGSGARLLGFRRDGAPNVLREALQISQVQLDHDGERLSFVASDLDEDDPTQLRFRLLAGAVP